MNFHSLAFWHERPVHEAMFEVCRIEAVYDDDDGRTFWRSIRSSVGFDDRIRNRIGFRDGRRHGLSPGRNSRVPQRIDRGA